MKHLARTFVIASLMMLVSGSCNGVPGTQEWKVRKVATAYIEQGLKDSERMHWGGNQWRIHLNVNGKSCTYAEVKYTVSSNEGDVPKTLYLLMSENCDSLYAATDKKGGDEQDTVWQAVNEAMGQSVEEAKEAISEELKEFGI